MNKSLYWIAMIVFVAIGFLAQFSVLTVQPESLLHVLLVTIGLVIVLNVLLKCFWLRSESWDSWWEKPLGAKGFEIYTYIICLIMMISRVNPTVR